MATKTTDDMLAEIRRHIDELEARPRNGTTETRARLQHRFDRLREEEAAAWAAARYPEWSSYINEARATYRADVHDQHSALISFTDHAVAEADGLIR